jgi:Aminotransferase class-III
LAREYPEIIKNVRGMGVMLAFDVQRADLRDTFLDRAFRRGLVLLAAGERAVRVYPRYDTELSAIDEALAILRAAITDLVGGIGAESTAALKVRVGALEIPLDTVELIDLTPSTFEAHKVQIDEVEQERYGDGVRYPPDVLRAGRRPLLQFPIETLQASVENVGAIGIAARDRVSGKFVGYLVGSALENYDEEGVASDPRFGENNTLYLLAMATLSTVQNSTDLENHLLDALRDRAIKAGFEFFSTLIEERVLETGPEWLRRAEIIGRIDNYLRSGLRFVYLQAPLQSASPPQEPDASRVLP